MHIFVCNIIWMSGILCSLYKVFMSKVFSKKSRQSCYYQFYCVVIENHSWHLFAHQSECLFKFLHHPRLLMFVSWLTFQLRGPPLYCSSFYTVLSSWNLSKAITKAFSAADSSSSTTNGRLCHFSWRETSAFPSIFTRLTKKKKKKKEGSCSNVMNSQQEWASHSLKDLIIQKHPS